MASNKKHLILARLQIIIYLCHKLLRPNFIMKKFIFAILACLSISFSSLTVEAAAATREYSNDGMGRIVLEKNMVNNVNTLAQDMFYKGEAGHRVPNANTIFIIQYDFVLAEDITIPENCILQFEGGSIMNATGNTYKVTGTRTKINTDVTYNIFNNTLGRGFELPYIDVRWVGGVSDYDENTKIGTDNAFAFKRAINLIGKYYNGMHINLVGQYYIGTTITTEYDLNITGYHHNSRELLGGSGHSIPTSPSLIVMGANTSFEMIGRAGSGTAKFCNFAIHNIKVIGLSSSSSSFIKCSAAGAPGRVSIVEECEFVGLGYCIYIFADYANTMVGDLTVSKCLAYNCNSVVFADSDTASHQTLVNCIIKDCNLEQGGRKCIYINNALGPVIIDNNILEGQSSPIYVHTVKGSTTITNNYFEANGKTAITVKNTHSANVVTIKNNFFNEKVKVFLSRCILYASDHFNDFTDDSVIYYCYIDTFKGFNLNWIPAEDYGTFVVFKEYNIGPDSSDNKSFRKGNIIGSKISISNLSYTAETSITSIAPLTAVFYATGSGNIGFYVNGSGRQSSYDAYKGGLVVFKQNPYATGRNILLMKSNKDDEIVAGPRIYKDGDTISLQDILIPDINTILHGKKRPSFSPMPIGYSTFCTDISPARTIWWNGSAWVDAMGTQVK